MLTQTQVRTRKHSNDQGSDDQHSIDQRSNDQHCSDHADTKKAMNDTRTTDSITIIGPAVIDVITGPVAFSSASLSQTVRTTRMTFGGDALNESVVLSRFHKNADLISKLGTDEAGARILSYLKNNGISARHV